MSLLSMIRMIISRRCSSDNSIKDDKYAAYLEKRKKLIEDGWVEWLYSIPQFPLVATRPDRDDNTHIYYSHDEVSPYLNVAGLYWRPWRGETVVTEFKDSSRDHIPMGKITHCQ